MPTDRPPSTTEPVDYSDPDSVSTSARRGAPRPLIGLSGLVGALGLVGGFWFNSQAASLNDDAAAADERAQALIESAVFVDAPATSNRVGLVTPLASLRRVPEYLRQPAAEASLAERLAGVVEAGPSNTCLVVSETSASDDPAARTELFSHQADLPVIPASTMKLLTAIAARDVLGDDHLFITEVRSTGPITEDGVVDSDVYFVGSGDPVLATDTYIDGFEEAGQVHTDLEDLADAMVAAGVTEVRGRLVGDEGQLDRARSVAAWPERFVTNNQAGVLSALSVNDGLVEFPENSRRQSLGTRVSDPAANAASILTALLQERGISITGGAASGTAPETASEVLASVTSDPLTDVNGQMLRLSDNTTAELLAKNIGLAASGEGSTSAGVAAIAESLERLGLPMAGVELVDGSGLSANARLTCDLVENLLSHSELGGLGSPIDEGLAVAGERGTLRKRYVDTPAQGRLRAKTGTLNQATALSGFVSTSGDRELVFAYVANDEFIDADEINIQNDLADALMSYPEGPALDELGPQAPPETAS